MAMVFCYGAAECLYSTGWHNTQNKAGQARAEGRLMMSCQQVGNGGSLCDDAAETQAARPQALLPCQTFLQKKRRHSQLLLTVVSSTTRFRYCSAEKENKNRKENYTPAPHTEREVMMRGKITA